MLKYSASICCSTVHPLFCLLESVIISTDFGDDKYGPVWANEAGTYFNVTDYRHFNGRTIIKVKNLSSPMEWWLWLGMASYLSYAISTSLDKYFMNKQYDPLNTNTIKMFFDGIILLVVGLLFFTIEFSMALLWWVLPLGFLYAAAGILYFKALQQEKAQVLIPYSQSSEILLLFAGAIFFFHESVSRANFIGVILLIFGIYIILSPQLFQFPLVGRGVALMSFKTILTVAYFLLVKRALAALAVHPISIAVGMYFSTTLFMLTYVFFVDNGKIRPLNFKTKSRSIFISAFFGALGTLLLYVALQMGKAVQVYPLAGMQVIGVFFITTISLREKFSRHRLLGTLLVFWGVYLVAL